MARETSGRPHELLSLKIGDVIFHNSEGKIYATITIGKEGKTIPRTVTNNKFNTLLQRLDSRVSTRREQKPFSISVIRQEVYYEE